MDERGPAVAAFYTWLATNGLDVECPDHVKFRLATFPWTGRGTRATVPIHEEDVLASVPRQLILSAVTATDSRVVRDVLPAVEGTILADPMVALALLLLYEKNLGPASFWAPYFHILLLPPLCRFVPLLAWWQQTKRNKPVQWIVYYNLPIFWSSEDLVLLEEAHTDILPHSRNMRTSILRLYFGFLLPLFHLLIFISIFKDYPDMFSPAVHTCDELMWAFATIWSRGYWLDGDDTMPAIVPLADMLNHNTEKGGERVAHYFYDADAQIFKVISKTSYEPGQQVLTHYGNKANGNFLEDYGFVYMNNDQNEFYLPIPAFVTQHMGPTHLRHVHSLIALRNIANAEHVYVKHNVFPSAVCNLFRTYLLSPAQLCSALDLPPVEHFQPETYDGADPSSLSFSSSSTPEAADGTTQEPVAELTYFVDVENEMATYELFIRCCDHWLASYSTTMADDAAFIEGRMGSGPSNNNNARMVRTLLHEEKRTIVHLRDCFEQMIAYVRDTGVDWAHVRLLDGQHVPK
ncbi:[Ribulose-bisphosphate-carboxylase]-lysine N-methyltransferase [Acanthamoeba castellanii str. Neff]|uniref:[Ribulose-bisphosphate-carboxylase]-lysine N-methyltransferase n=1 Tax=Acanthamoeba castellanii (strain ATCC 30010 / Neff) TaxID=1257118 RepID=L8HDZ8_ACACF|nr:[Ribulose-bisphosphate-carboxylase]-lysine N-methyltransferase [Acanthamoeba castellanii str. Neff]ELR23759.1 [Ribulose-bisphosphate-carboxylase]-lysine N-methyltransferase [Acanthamoeba castellanii str. Neff]